MVLGAGISDVADGWLARRWKVESWQGGMLDAVADKIFVFVVVCVLAVAGKFSPIWIPIILLRDIVVATTACYVLFCGMWQSYKKLGARASGKLATAGQFALFVVVLLYPAGSIIALVFASICSIWAAYDYGRLFVKVLNRSLKNP